MLTQNDLNNIMNPIKMNEHISEEKIIDKFGDINCYFHIYRNKYFKKGINLISVSYFLMENVDEIYSKQKGKTVEQHQLEHHKKIQLYFNGLKTIIKKNKNINLFTTIRIYCDISTAKYVESFLFDKFVEVYVYYFPDFFDTKKMVHFGFFGTLIRYLPLFNLQYHNNGDWKSTTILDIDTIFKDEPKVMKYFLNKKETPNLLFWNKNCYYLTPRLAWMDINPPYFSIMSGLIMQKVPQNFEIFSDFLNNCLLKHCPQYEKMLSKYLQINLNKRIFKGKLEYGVDEFFINTYFLNKFYIQSNQEFLEVFIRDNGFPLKEWFLTLKLYKQPINNPKLLTEFLLFILAIFTKDFKLPPYKNVNDLIDIIYNEFFGNQKYYNMKYPQKFYEKLVEVVEKIGPQEINMPENILICLKRSVKLFPNDIIIKSVKPHPQYPKFSEKIINKIRNQ